MTHSNVVATRVVSTLVLFASVFLVSCGSEDGFETAPTPPRGFLRMVNAVPDSPALRFIVEEREEATLRFGEASQFAGVLPDVPLDFSVTYFDDGTSVQLITDQFAIAPDGDFTAVVTGTLDSPRLILIDNSPVDFADDTNESEIQFAHAAANGPDSVDIFVSEQSEPNSVLGFGEATAVQTLSANVEAEINVHSPGETEALWSSGPFAFSAATRQLLLLVDYFGPGDTPVRMLAIGQNGARPFPEEDLPAALRVANMIPDRGPLDVTVDSNLVAENIDFTDVTDHIELTSGELPIRVTPTGQPDTIVFEGDSEVVTGQFQTLTVAGLDTDTEVSVSEDNARRLSLGATISVSHSSPGVEDETLDVYLLEQGQEVTDTRPDLSLNFLVTGTVLVDPGSFDLVVTTSGTDDIIFGPQRIDLVRNGIFKVFIHDTPGGGTPVQITLGDDFVN
ncbi:MAG: DUF4397 domain-containing protein [Pseudomonadales bacterium]